MAQNRANLPPAGRQSLRGDQLCETNPIRPGLDKAGTRAAERCKTNPIWRPPRWSEPDGSCKTKPIGPRAGPTLGPIMQNEPNSWRWGRSWETNPISGQPGGWEPSIVRNEANSPPRAQDWARAAGEQLCETKPIPPDRQRGASALRERSYGELDTQKASAKRTQFADAPGDGRGPAKLLPEQNAQNEPNLPPRGRKDHRQSPRP